MAQYVALIELVVALTLGAAFVWWLRFPLYVFEATAVAVVTGLLGWTWLAFLCSLVLPYSAAVPLSLVLALALAGGLWWWRRDAGRWQWRPLEGGRTAWWVWGGATALTVVVLGRLFWTHSLPADSGGVWSAGSSWADYGLHAAIISHFAAFDSLPTDLPVASGTNNTYPFLVDFLSALLVKGGWSLHASMFVPGVLLVLSICQLVMSFSLRLFRRIGAAVGGLALILLTGSAVGLALAWQDWRASGLSLGAFLRTLPRDYTTVSDHAADVTNIVNHALLPQRAFLFGMSTALVVFILLQVTRETGRRDLLYAAALLIGLLPMAHPHSFLVCGAVLIAVTVEAGIRARAVPWHHLAAGVGALVVAAPQLAWQQLGSEGGTGGRWRLWWELQPGHSLPGYWFANFGLMGIFFVVLPFLLLRREWRGYLVWFLPMLAVLVVSQVYAFQPFEYDNLKLIYYVYVMAALFLAFLMGVAFRAAPWSLVLTVPVVLAIAIPGALAIRHEFQLRDQFASAADEELAEWVRTSTDPGDVFLTTDRVAQPIATLGGRSIVMGYRGWLYNFAIPYADREAAVAAGLLGRVDDPAVRALAPDYLAVATYEDPSFPVDPAALAGLPVAYQNDEWTVYALSP